MSLIEVHFQLPLYIDRDAPIMDTTAGRCARFSDLEVLINDFGSLRLRSPIAFERSNGASPQLVEENAVPA